MRERLSKYQKKVVGNEKLPENPIILAINHFFSTLKEYIGDNNITGHDIYPS